MAFGGVRECSDRWPHYRRIQRMARLAFQEVIDRLKVSFYPITCRCSTVLSANMLPPENDNINDWSRRKCNCCSSWKIVFKGACFDFMHTLTHIREQTNQHTQCRRLWEQHASKPAAPGLMFLLKGRREKSRGCSHLIRSPARQRLTSTSTRSEWSPTKDAGLWFGGFCNVLNLNGLIFIFQSVLVFFLMFHSRAGRYIILFYNERNWITL